MSFFVSRVSDLFLAMTKLQCLFFCIRKNFLFPKITKEALCLLFICQNYIYAEVFSPCTVTASMWDVEQ